VLALASLALSLGDHETAVGVWSQTTVDIRECVLEPGWEHQLAAEEPKGRTDAVAATERGSGGRR
jgi:Zn ribbon nucleic-acid-binding protein